MSTTASRLAIAPAPTHVSLAAVVLRWCTTCATETTFEQPVCEDHRGADCPEWSCVECGEGLLLGFDLPEVARPGAAHRAG